MMRYSIIPSSISSRPSEGIWVEDDDGRSSWEDSLE